SRFVMSWIRELRKDPALREAGILIRPHPQKPEEWRDVDLSGLDQVAVWPRGGAKPLDRDTRAGYYDALYHAALGVGINTSALIEGAIVGRPVFTVLAPEFAETQEGTLHFHHLVTVNGGLLHVARLLGEHVAQLKQELEHPGGAEKSRRFVHA